MLVLVLVLVLVLAAGAGCWCWLLVLAAGAGCWLLEEGREEDRGDGQRHTLARPLARRFGLLDAGSVRRLAAGTPYVALEQASIDRCLACGLRKCYFTHHG